MKNGVLVNSIVYLFGFPLGFTIFFFASYFGVKFGFDLLVFQYQIELIWFILLFLVFFGLAFLVANFMPLVLEYLTLQFYWLSLVLVFVFPIASALGVYEALSYIYKNPPLIAGLNGEVANFPDGLWELSKFRTIMLAIQATFTLCFSLYLPVWMLVIVWLRREKRMGKMQHLYFSSFLLLSGVLVFYHFCTRIPHLNIC